MNKTIAIELEDYKNRILEAVANEETKLWHGSSQADEGFNNAVERIYELIKYEVK